MLKKSINNVILTQVVSLIGAVGCVGLRPHGLVADAGLSYFGNYKTTIIPYGLVLIGGSWFYYKARKSLPTEGYKLTKMSFGLFSILYICIFITPYSVSQLMSWTHSIVGIILFSYQLVIGAWIVIRSGFNRFLEWSWLIMLASGIACAIYSPVPKGYLLEGQIIFEISFSFLYIKYLSMSRSVHRSTEGGLTPLLSSK